MMGCETPSALAGGIGKVVCRLKDQIERARLASANQNRNYRLRRFRAAAVPINHQRLRKDQNGTGSKKWRIIFEGA